MAWEALDKEDKAEILSLFPDNQHVLAIGSDDARPDLVSLMNDDSFRHDCAVYVEHIAQGRHDVEWLASAWAAHERRKAGDFDEFLEDKFEEEWGVYLPPEMKPNRGGLFDKAADEIVVKTDATKETNGHDDKDDTRETNGIAEKETAEEGNDDTSDTNVASGTNVETTQDLEVTEMPERTKDAQSSQSKDGPDLPDQGNQQQNTDMEVDGTNITNGVA